MSILERLVQAYHRGESCQIEKSEVPEMMKLIDQALTNLKRREASRNREVTIQQMVRLRRKILRDTRTDSSGPI